MEFLVLRELALDEFINALVEILEAHRFQLSWRIRCRILILIEARNELVQCRLLLLNRGLMILQLGPEGFDHVLDFVIELIESHRLEVLSHIFRLLVRFGLLLRTEIDV